MPSHSEDPGSGFLSEGSSSLTARIGDKYQIRLTRPTFIQPLHISHLMRLWYFSSAVNSFFKHTCTAIQWGFIYCHTLSVRTAKALARLRECAGSPEPSLVSYVISTIISWAAWLILPLDLKNSPGQHFGSRIWRSWQYHQFSSQFLPLSRSYHTPQRFSPAASSHVSLSSPANHWKQIICVTRKGTLGVCCLWSFKWATSW